MNAALGNSKQLPRVNLARAAVVSFALALWLAPLIAGAMEPAHGFDPNATQGTSLRELAWILGPAGLLGGALAYFRERAEPGATCDDRAAKLAHNLLRAAAATAVVPLALSVAQDIPLNDLDFLAKVELFGLALLAAISSKNLPILRRCAAPEVTDARRRLRSAEVVAQARRR